MIETRVILAACVIFSFCEAASIVDCIDKCGLRDSECQMKLYSAFLREVETNGIPEMDIPIIDPYEVKDMNIQVLGMIKASMVGTVSGFKTCKAKTFEVDIPNHLTTVEIVCEKFSMEGNYKIEKTPALSALIGNIDIHGEGKGKAVVDNIQLNLEIACNLKKLENGELHFEVNGADTTYTYQILGKTSVDVDSLYIGKQEISAVAVNIFNENWEVFSKTFAPIIIDEGLKVFYKEVNKFFKNVPANKLISDDISAYAN